MRFRDGLSRHLQGFSHQQALTRLKDAFGFTPGVIYDLGTYHGNWTKPARRVYPGMLVKEYGLPFPDLIKLDVQGSELASEVMARVHEPGFEPVDICKVRRGAAAGP